MSDLGALLTGGFSTTTNMKTNLLAVLTVLVAIAGGAQSERYVTIIAGPGSGATATTNQVSVAETETAQVVDFITVPNGSQKFVVVKDGVTFDKPGQVGPPPTPSFVKGPAQIILTAGYGQRAMLTLRLLPDSYDVNKTVILPPGTNQVFVSLETSTNLVNWTTATNGVYGSPDYARFFRVKMTAQQ